MRRPAAKVGRALSRLRRLEFPGRRAAGAANRAGCRESSLRLCFGGRVRQAVQRHPDIRCSPHSVGHRRVRSRSWRRHRSGRARAPWRRARHRKVDAAAAGCRARCADRRSRPLQLRRGVGASDQAARRAARGGPGASISAGRNVPRAHPRRDRAPQAGARDRRFDSDDFFRALSIRPWQHRPGARSGHASAVRRKGPQRADRAGRPCHEGRESRRAESAGACRRHGAVFRRRAPSCASRRARVQEPLRRGERARRVRDDGDRAPGSAEPVADVPRRALDRQARAPRCSAASKARGRYSSKCRHWSPAARSGTRAEWRAASISSACRCCWP